MDEVRPAINRLSEAAATSPWLVHSLLDFTSTLSDVSKPGKADLAALFISELTRWSREKPAGPGDTHPFHTEFLQAMAWAHRDEVTQGQGTLSLADMKKLAELRVFREAGGPASTAVAAAPRPTWMVIDDAVRLYMKSEESSDPGLTAQFLRTMRTLLAAS